MRHTTTALLLASLAPLSALTAAGGPAISAEDLAFFETKIRPVLADQCYRCHSSRASRVRGDLLLDTRDGTLNGGETGPAVVPGRPEQSLLLEAIRYENPDLQMPPKGNKLSDEIIADFAEWIRRGAPDPRETAAVVDASTDPAGAHDYAPNADHWAFKPVVQPAVPSTQHPEWARTPVDHFILADLEQAGMQPSPAADRRTLLRRVTYNLTGLPPTTAEINAFVNDPAPDAYEKVVDRLLASPHYGEHMARQWLDIARFADTKGTIKQRREDPRYAGAWTYRDYVIDAFNTDKPYDAFITEQLAADQIVLKELNRKTLPADTDPDDRSILAALGFLTVGNKFDGNNNDVINDRIDVTSKALLGLTVSCARCHDHKFDPIPTQDYYSLYGIFANTRQPRGASANPTLQPVADTPEYRAYLAKVSELENRQTELLRKIRDARRSGQLDQSLLRQTLRQQVLVNAELGDLADSDGAPARAEVLTDSAYTKDYPVLIRGEAQSKGEIAPRRFLAALSPEPDQRPLYRQGGGRLELARDIADPANPLTARVLVNRIWQQHFGDGFVLTPDDFGNQSAPPSHPQLLDYLAARFTQDAWSVKNLHRLIVLSATYRQGDSLNPTFAEKDPYNRLLWRYNLRRLGFEEMHDSILAISGTLDPTIGGKSVRLSSEGFASRRALYTFVDRSNPPELFTQFDFPSPDVPSGRRHETSVPQQALFFMNNPFIIETARTLTERPEFLRLTRKEDRVESLYLSILQRAPTVSEIRLALRYVETTPADLEMPANTGSQNQRRERPNFRNRFADTGPVGGAKNEGPLDAWARLAHALFQTNEAVYYN